MILLDTHSLIWFLERNLKLGTQTTRLIQQGFDQQQVTISAISFWEIEMLKNKQRVILSDNTLILRNELLGCGLTEIPITGEIGILANQLDLHPDPADRLIVATALTNHLTLITADGKILDWQDPIFNLITHNAKL